MLPRLLCLLCLQDMAARFPDGLPLLDPVEDMGITGDDQLMEAVKNMHSWEQQLVKNPGGLQQGMLYVFHTQGWMVEGIGL